MLAYFLFTDSPTTEIYTLSLHDALPISPTSVRRDRPASEPHGRHRPWCRRRRRRGPPPRQDRYVALTNRCQEDRKSTRLNSSHTVISYAVFCLKKKTTTHYCGMCAT